MESPKKDSTNFANALPSFLPRHWVLQDWASFLWDVSQSLLQSNQIGGKQLQAESEYPYPLKLTLYMTYGARGVCNVGGEGFGLLSGSIYPETPGLQGCSLARWPYRPGYTPSKSGCSNKWDAAIYLKRTNWKVVTKAGERFSLWYWG